MVCVKKIICCFFMFISFMFISCNTFATENVTLNKKVVSLVFDDSGSMKGEKAENANYALQALISMLGQNDELNIVRMSSPTTYNTFKLKEPVLKQSSINDVREWKCIGMSTPFDAVDTARDFLLERKRYLGDNAEYWLIIITDGEFNAYKNGNVSVDIYSYMTDINNTFTGLKFDSILLSIGSKLDKYYVDAFKTLPNCSAQEVDSPSEIIPAMFEISSKINSRLNAQEVKKEKISNNQIAININLPIYKMNVFIQKNGLEIKEITSANNEKTESNIYNIKTDTKSAQMNEFFSNKGYLESGKYIITFNDDVDLDATQIKIFVQVAVENVLKLYKEGGSEELKDIDFYTLKADDKVIAKSELISLIDGNPIDINNLENVYGFYYINDKESYGKFDKNALVTYVPIEQGKTTIYSLIQSDGFINAKSNVIVINLENLPEVLMQYNNSKSYEKNGEVNLGDIADGSSIAISNLPNGVSVEYDGMYYSNGDKILLNDNKNLIIKSNKDYRETSYGIVQLEIDSKDKKFFKITPEKVKYGHVKVDKNQNDINMDDGILKLAIEYETEDGIQRLNVSDIKKNKIDDVSNGYKIKAKLDEETNEIILKVTPKLSSIFSEHEIKFQITSELKDVLGSANTEFELGITNYNLLQALIPIIVLVLLFIILLGYLLKNRFSKQAYMLISSEDQPYSLKDCTTGIKKYLPFVSNTVKLPNVKIKALKNNKIQLMSSMEEILEVNGEKDIPKKIILSINNGEFINNQNVKYEYVSLTPDEIIEASEEKSKNEENWF